MNSYRKNLAIFTVTALSLVSGSVFSEEIRCEISKNSLSSSFVSQDPVMIASNDTVPFMVETRHLKKGCTIELMADLGQPIQLDITGPTASSSAIRKTIYSGPVKVGKSVYICGNRTFSLNCVKSGN